MRNLYTHPQDHGLQIYTEFVYRGHKDHAKSWIEGPVVDKFVVWVNAKDPDAYYWAETRACSCDQSSCTFPYRDENLMVKRWQRLSALEDSGRPGDYKDMCSRVLRWIVESAEFYGSNEEFESSLVTSLGDPQALRIVDTLVHSDDLVITITEDWDDTSITRGLALTLRARARARARVDQEQKGP